MKRSIAGLGLLALLAGGGAMLAYAASGTEEPAQVATDAKEYREIEWDALTPPLSAKAQQAAAELNMRIDEMSNEQIAEAMSVIDSEGSVLVQEIDDTDVAIEGFLVPLDFDAERVSEFVLVPYFGACIHVPPPPPNQIAYVKFREGLATADLETAMFTPFRVQGRIEATPMTTELAEVGYSITATEIKAQEIE